MSLIPKNQEAISNERGASDPPVTSRERAPARLLDTLPQQIGEGKAEAELGVQFRCPRR